MWHTGPDGGRGQAPVTGLRERAGESLPLHLGSVLLPGPPTRRLLFLPLPPFVHTASPCCGEELAPASPGILGIPRGESVPVVTALSGAAGCPLHPPSMAVPCPGPALCDGPQLGGVTHGSCCVPWGQCEGDVLERGCGSKRDGNRVAWGGCRVRPGWGCWSVSLCPNKLPLKPCLCLLWVCGTCGAGLL